jgi:hypothetical protein
MCAAKLPGALASSKIKREARGSSAANNRANGLTEFSKLGWRDATSGTLDANLVGGNDPMRQRITKSKQATDCEIRGRVCHGLPSPRLWRTGDEFRGTNVEEASREKFAHIAALWRTWELVNAQITIANARILGRRAQGDAPDLGIKQKEMKQTKERGFAWVKIGAISLD